MTDRLRWYHVVGFSVLSSAVSVVTAVIVLILLEWL